MGLLLLFREMHQENGVLTFVNKCPAALTIDEKNMATMSLHNINVSTVYHQSNKRKPNKFSI